MFHAIPQTILGRMQELDQIDSRDRADGTPRMQRLRQIPPEVGRFIALLAAAAPEGDCIEIGTSAGYSTLWLALACRATGRSIKTFEILDEKAALAKATFEAAGVTEVVELVHGDALVHLPKCREIGFCFLDSSWFNHAADQLSAKCRFEHGGWQTRRARRDATERLPS